jgi:serine/threonine protein kinase
MIDSEIENRLNALCDALPGQVLSGSDGRRYPLGARLGAGGQGWIFRATWNGSVDVVVKVLRPDAMTKDSRARFEREATVLRTISQQAAPNPHIVRYYDHAAASLTLPGTGETWQFPFTVLEYVEGETLADAIGRERDARGTGIGLQRSRRLLRHIVLALRDVHAHNVIHRDLKPSNVLLDSIHGRGEREVAKVTDFGLAKVFDDAMHRTSALAGATVGYAPPEQFEKGNLRVGAPTDVFSLAAIFFEMLTGEPAFAFSEPMQVLHSIIQGHRPTLANTLKRVPDELKARPDVIAAHDEVLNRALALQPESRYATVVLFQDAVEGALGALGTDGMRLSDRPSGHHVRPSVERGPRVGVSLPAPPVSGEAVTMRADEETRSAGLESVRPPVILSRPPPASLPQSPVQLQWQMSTPPAWPRPLRAIVVAPDTRGAVGVGVDGLGYWSGRAWSRLELPRFVAPATVEALAWFGTHLVVAGASSTVHLMAPDGTFTPFVFSLPGLVFHAAFADSQGIVLAGEQVTHAGAVGVVAMLTLQYGGILFPSWVTLPQAGPLRAVTRFDQMIFTCGDRGALAVLRGGEMGTIQACAQPLLALTPAGDGGAIAVGGGGFAFHVKPTLEARLEAVQTTRTLTAVARGLDGALYCGGEDRRVLRRAPGGWIRLGATAGVAGATIRALSAGNGGVTAFCDDGSVLEGFGTAASLRG